MRRVLALAVLFLSLSVTPARADLINLGNGMIYDTVQDLTWVQDTLLARTQGFGDSRGRMTNTEAVDWVSNLTFGGYDDWRLPRIYDIGIHGRTGLYSESDSEISTLMAQLGWQWDLERMAQSGGQNYGTQSSTFFVQGSNGPFLGLEMDPLAHRRYWVESPVYEEACGTLCFAWFTPYELEWAWYHSQTANVWAVRDGLARVPEPSTLLTVALGSLLLLRRRLKTKTLRVLMLSMSCVFVSVAPARAELINLGNGMIYDTVQDLTWLQDLNFVQHSGFDADGRLTYDQAEAYADWLTFGGYDDWRLPRSRNNQVEVLSDDEVTSLMNQLGGYPKLEPNPDPNYEWVYTGYQMPSSLSPFFGTFMPNWVAQAPGSPHCSTNYYLHCFAFMGWTTIDLGGYHNWDERPGPTVWAVRDGRARVPEPSTLVLVAIGAGLGLRRYRRVRPAGEPMTCGMRN